MGVTVFLYIKVPKGFFPQQDTGRLRGAIVGQQLSTRAAASGMYSPFEIMRVGTGDRNGSVSAGAQCSSCSSLNQASSSREPGTLSEVDIVLPS